MASDWTLHSGSGRLLQTAFTFAGEPYYRWDISGGLWIPLSHKMAYANQSASIVPPHRSTAECGYQQMNQNPCGYPVEFAHGAVFNSDNRDRGQDQQLAEPGGSRNGVHDSDLHSDNRHQSPDSGIEIHSTRQHAGNYMCQNMTNVAQAQGGGHFDWGFARINDEARVTPGHGSGQESLFDGSEASASERSDSSSRSIEDDLHGLSLRDHASLKLISPFGKSSRSRRYDPILGDVQRKHDTLIRLSLEPSYMISASAVEHDTLDPRYKRQNEPRRFFKVGRVFAMLWHENAGQHGTIVSQRGPPTSPHFTRGKYQEPIYSSIRRMVVVKEQKGCCWCVPITTYSGQGVAKGGVDRSKHAVIYMRGSRPWASPGEPKMIKEPLEVEPARLDQKLDPMSRLNFGKVYTVEHNVKVLPVGKIAEGSMAKFAAYARAEFTRLDLRTLQINSWRKK